MFIPKSDRPVAFGQQPGCADVVAENFIFRAVGCTVNLDNKLGWQLTTGLKTPHPPIADAG
jgi:hypothetical protein